MNPELKGSSYVLTFFVLLGFGYLAFSARTKISKISQRTLREADYYGGADMDWPIHTVQAHYSDKGSHLQRTLGNEGQRGPHRKRSKNK